MPLLVMHVQAPPTKMTVAALPLPTHLRQLATPAGTSPRTTATTPGSCSITSGTRTSPTLSGTRSWRSTGPRRFGEISSRARAATRSRPLPELPPPADGRTGTALPIVAELLQYVENEGIDGVEEELVVGELVHMRSLPRRVKDVVLHLWRERANRKPGARPCRRLSLSTSSS